MIEKKWHFVLFYSSVICCCCCCKYHYWVCSYKNHEINNWQISDDGKSLIFLFCVCFWTKCIIYVYCAPSLNLMNRNKKKAYMYILESRSNVANFAFRCAAHRSLSYFLILFYVLRGPNPYIVVAKAGPIVGQQLCGVPWSRIKWYFVA